MKKGMAFLLSGIIACSSICLQAPTAKAVEKKIETEIAEDGTIYTYVKDYNIDGLMYEYAYPAFEKDAYIGEYRNKDEDYVVRVTCKDAEAFTAAFSEQYHLTLLEDGIDGDYVVTDINDSDYKYAAYSAFCGSTWTYAEADNAARTLMLSDTVQQVSIEKGYKRLTWGLTFSKTFQVCSESALTEEDFAWMGDTCSIESMTETVGSHGYTYVIGLSNSGWGIIRYFMKGCMENIPSVYGVNNTVIQIALAIPYTYEVEKTYQSTGDYLGDIDSDGTVSVEDAVSTLTYYAQQSAGLEANLTQAADTEESAFLAADVDGDGQITVEDAVAILTYYAKKSAGLDTAW